MPILFRGCDIEDAFLTEADLMNRFVGQELWVWGGGTQGGSGINATTSRSSPVQTFSGGTNWSQVSSGGWIMAAIKTDGTLWTWGYNIYGQLGINSTANRSTPTQTISGGTNWKNVAAAAEKIVSTKTDGTLWNWGRNSGGGAGGLGDNSTSGNLNRSSPVQTVSGGTNWKKVSARCLSASIKTDGTLWVWGANGGGQLGDNTTVSRSSPIQTIAGGTNWKDIVGHIALKTDGTLWTWGFGTSGILGNSSTINHSSPIQTISGGTNWKFASSGPASIKNDGTLWVWGANTGGKLGNNSTINHSSPIQTISGGTNWRVVGSSGANTSAVKTDGTFWVWGINSSLGNNGMLGNNTSTGNLSSPIQTVAGGTNWRTAVESDVTRHVAGLRITGE